MDRKYWVPALEKAHAVTRLVAEEPGQLKLTDLCKRLEISKSSMFSLLQTMEALHWLARDRSDTYTLGMHFGMMGSAFFRQFDLIDAFRKEAPAYMREVNESIQLASLEGKEIVYMAKEAAPSLVQMVSGPGTRLPAHATGLGKMLLSALDETQLGLLYTEDSLSSLTPFTLRTKQELLKQLAAIRQQGYALDLQEGVMGFNCIAVPIYQSGNKMIAAISFSMPLHNWEEKREQALKLILSLANKLSFSTNAASENN
ncbi:helix-turn-helix domain-containing protein [Paenibacillus sp. LMG 31456]|uniref:Helix-turn-helix domain-containing protein n=1 Tax=Paenibacillus foliorum TaxID=2654974 RepID=A0A972GXU6_9BACL|nr:IclR family transcriptional regulator [Paenibacillus foliorum]NOU95777.1 helix-turn-helix domain-containing protein [Paenibacillus foliorum]